MALDPRIILAGQQVTPTDPNEEAVKAGQASEALALARQRIQASQDDASFKTAMQQAGGDPDKAITLLQSTNPRAALTYGAMITKQRQDNLKLAADQSDFLGKQTDAALKLFQGVGNDPKQYQIALRGAFGILHDTPAGDQLAALPQNPTPDEIPGLVDSILQKGMSAKDYHEQITSGLKTWLGGDPVAGLAHMLEVTDDPQMRQSIIQSAKAHGAPDAFVTAATSLSNQVTAGADPKTFRQLLGPQNPIKLGANETLIDPVTQKPIFTSPPPAATPYQVDSLAERTRHDKAMENKPAAAAVVLPGNSDTVQGYIQDVLTGSKKLSDVPAAGGTRNSVVAELHKEGYDITKPLTAQTQARVEFAQGVLPQVSQVADLAHQIDAAGLTGTVGGRLRRLAAGESAGAVLADLTPEQRRLVGQFTTKAGLLVSGIAMVHGGARGGGSTQMLEQLKPLLDPHNKDLQTYLGNLDAAKDILDGYAQMGQSLPKGNSAKDPLGIRKGSGD